MSNKIKKAFDDYFGGKISCKEFAKKISFKKNPCNFKVMGLYLYQGGKNEESIMV